EVEVNPKLRAQVGMPIRDHVDPFDRRNLIKASPYGLVASLTSFWFPVEKDPPGLFLICPGRLCDICYARYYGQTITTVPDPPCYSVALEEIYPQQGPPATRSGITGTRTRERARYWQTGKAA